MDSLSHSKLIQQQYALASDGTPLHWVTLAPGTGSYPSVLMIHAGEFHGGTDAQPINVCGASLKAAGFSMFSIEHRLCPPGHLAGQTSSGCYPDQTDDVAIAIAAVLNHPLCNGSLQILGGSSGGSHALWAAAHDPRILSALLMSPVTHLEAGTEMFNTLCEAYAPGQLEEASPVTYVDADTSPTFLRFYETDNIPRSNYDLLQASLIDSGVENNCALLPGVGHSFPMWSTIKTEAIAWLLAHV